MRRDTEHRDETIFLVRVDELVDGDLALNYLAAKLSFDLVCHVYNGLPIHSVKDAAIIWWRDQFHIAVARLLQHEDIKNGHLLDIVVKEPEHIVEAVHFGICDAGH